MKKGWIILVSVLTGWLSAFGLVQPAGVFTDGTVLQQGQPVRVWGTADPGEAVSVAFAGQEKKVITSEDGKWQVILDPMTVSSEPRTIVFSSSVGKRQSEISNVLVGEVWLAGGQSNMATKMKNYSKTTQPDIDSANDPLLRIVAIPQLAFEGQNDLKPEWRESTPQNVAAFPASAYYFAKNLRAALNVPVGIVSCNYGGTPAEAWMSRETLESHESLRPVLEAYDSYCRDKFPDEKSARTVYDDYVAQMDEYTQKRAVGDRPRRPRQAMSPFNFMRPCGLHETMLSQVIPYTVHGTIWYQGENNAAAGQHYRAVFSTLIEEWRAEFLNPEMPFLFVQLATYGPKSDTAPDWAELRDAQSWTEKNVKNTGMAVLVDGGEENNIHPHSKDKVGYRLCLLARNMVYGETSLVCRGPQLEIVERSGGSIALGFNSGGAGLVLKPEADSAFEIAGADGKFVPARAELVDGKIMVSADGVLEPKDVRYGWKKWFVPTLFNAEGLPASPFRTDNQPLTSEGRYLLDNLGD